MVGRVGGLGGPAEAAQVRADDGVAPGQERCHLVPGRMRARNHGVKRGDIRALGASAYAGPLLSTLLLILFGRAEPSWRILLAAVLIVGGAALAAKDMLGRRG